MAWTTTPTSNRKSISSNSQAAENSGFFYAIIRVMIHRTEGYALLDGSGLEVGAFNEPAALPDRCSIRYFDALDADEAAKRFPELDPSGLVPVDIIGDIDKRDLRSAGEASFDFAVANHVIEHVACPIAMIEDLFFILKEGGHLVISAPDKRFTFDKERSLTPFDHLEREYREGVDEVDDEHYMDFLRHVAKHVFEEPGRDIAGDLAWVRARREHAHVWDSDSFLDFLDQCKRVLGIRFDLDYLCKGDANNIECFAVLKKRATDA